MSLPRTEVKNTKIILSFLATMPTSPTEPDINSSLYLNELRRQLLMDRNASLQALAEGPQRTARERKVRRGATIARAKYK